MRASLITVGDELLIGQVVDTNAAWIGRFLDERGVRLVAKATVGDDAADIARAIHRAAEEADVVLLTGGLGPTPDDITLEVLAAALGRAVAFDAPTYARIEHIFREVIKRPLSPAHRRQAMLPVGATTLRNEQGTAPGVWVEEGGKVYVAMPGVPREMRYLMEHEVVPRLVAAFAVSPRRHVTLHTSGWGETQVASAIAPVAEALPAHVRLAYLPSLGTVRLRLSATGPDVAALDAELATWRERIVALLPERMVFGFDDVDLLGATRDALAAGGARVATAESCTGGAVAAALASRPGASAYFLGAVVAYDNRLKRERLGVGAQTLREHGAVSEATVREMVAGACRELGATHAVATSGIAGPGGGTAEKPVGTVWVAAGTEREQVARLLSLGRDRATNIAYATNAALDLLRRLLLGEAAG